MLLKNGSTGWWVKMIQQDLDMIGYSLAVDGVFGPLTEQAVRDFQQKAGISADGIFGPITWDKMQAALNALGTFGPFHRAPIVKIIGSEYGFAFYFILEIKGQEFQFMLDTGDASAQVTFGQTSANLLNLPVLGEKEVTTADGRTEMWPQSKIDLTLGSKTFECDCNIDPNGGDNLLGLPFFIKNKIWMAFHPETDPPTLAFYQG